MINGFVSVSGRQAKSRTEEYMRVLFWYCGKFGWTPAMKTLEDAPDAAADGYENAVVAFVHVEPADGEKENAVETKLVKNAKWLARKWETDLIVLHSFTHLGEEKADPALARALLGRARERLEAAGYHAHETPYGYFHDLAIRAPGHPLARIYKSF